MKNSHGFVFMFVVLLAQLVDGKVYKEHERISVLANTIAPYNNPAETYRYNKLPFCRPDPRDILQRKLDPSVRMAGDRAVPSPYVVNFRDAADWKSLCKRSLTPNDVRDFVQAIKKDMVFELFVDGLSVFGYVGTQKTNLHNYQDHIHNTTQFYLFCHYDFSIAFNGGHVIAVNLTTDPTKQVMLEMGKIDDMDVEFSYSVRWVETHVSYENRNMLHVRPAIHDNAIEIHWLSIINSFVLVILLTAFLAIILMRILRNDFSRYADHADEEVGDEIDDSGWKQVHGDVFRIPQHTMFFSAAIGNGAQVLAMTVAILCLAVSGFFDPGNRGMMYQALIALYAPTAVIAGYVSAKLYTQLGGKKWATNAVLTFSLFTVPFLVTFSVINTVAIAYNSTSAIPFWTIIMTLLWGLVTFPLTVLGASRGTRTTKMDVPCKTNRVPREIPPTTWYRQPPVQMFMAGFLPFTAIYIELHYIFASVWGHRVYTLFGVLSLAFIMLIIVTSFITIALAYFQLTVEDYRWWWRSFFSGGATGLFIYAYAIFYYFYRSQMTGILQGTFFFGYVLMISYAFFLMLGTIGFFSTLTFVKHIYSVIKSD